MDRRYLPSKKFIAIVIFIVAIIAIFFAGKALISFLKNKKTGPNKPANVIVAGELMQKDSNKNGIPDWEEYLWGLDPNKSGPENKEFILARKNSLIQSGEMMAPDDSKAITDHEMLSQEFFATIVALQQTGQLDETAVNSVSEAVGKNIETTPIPDIYTWNILTIKNDSTLANTNYSNALTTLINNYLEADIGSELTFIIQGLSNKDPSALYAAQTVAEAYQSFGKEFIKIPVPKSLAQVHLSAANNYEKTGQSLNDLVKILADPLIGMKAIISYKNYNEALASDLEKISEFLQ